MYSPDHRPPISSKFFWLGALCIACCILRAPARWEYDSIELVKGTLELKRWLTDPAHGPLGDIGAFAPFQYLTALPTFCIPRCPVSAMDAWSLCSRLSLAGLAGLFLRAGRRAGAVGGGLLMVFVLLCGPLTAYATSTFNELPAAFLTAAFVAAAMRQRTVLTPLLFILAGLTKETAWPLLTIFWIFAASTRQPRGRIWPLLVAYASALIVTLVINCGLNWIRYHSLFNQHYLEPRMHVPNLGWRAEFCAALWLSPNGGVLSFWPAWIAVVVALRVRSHRKPGLRRGVWITIAIVLGTLTYGLANWHTPFGWWCWGPRLLLPWLPALLYLLLWAYPQAVEGLARLWTATNKRTFVTGIIALLLATPHVLMLRDDDAVQRFFHDDHHFDTPQTMDDPAIQHAYTSYQAWSKQPFMLLLPLEELKEPANALMLIVFAGGLAALLYTMRIAALRSSEP